ncbi:LysR family transcriptional regulator [Duganella sp. Leaf61]|uniref:LysR family transcriptional regulator n=1 Tax=Duganella sp. Leaf61 TaxID=1736227 RepID=UPI00070239CD|nr:LysR family transcriptional regulator [Duganella sp. Leaf61]KQN69152.1 LysR family transcriptional regulator [Duganella sp. Leaf61]
MDFRDLKFFEVIAQEGNLARAAEKLFRTQPALSKCIDRLESSMGAKLFEKDGRGMRLTVAGNVLLSRTRQMGLMIEDTAREMRDHAAGLKGHIRLGCVPTLAEHLLPQILHDMLEQAPEVTIRLGVAMNDALLAGLRGGEFDLVVGPMLESDQEFVSEQIVEDQMVVVASKQHPLFAGPYTMADLLAYRWVLPATTVASRQWLDQTFDRNRLARPQVHIESTVLNMILPVIEKTRLLGFASNANLRSPDTGLREVVLEQTTMPRRMGVLYRSNTYLSPAMARIAGLLRLHGTSLHANGSMRSLSSRNCASTIG